MTRGPHRWRSPFVWICIVPFVVLSAGCDFFISSDERVARAEEWIERGDHRSAMIELQNAVQKDPDHLAARLALAEVKLHLGDAAGAEGELRRAIASGADPTAAPELTARIRLGLNQFRELLAQIDAGEIALEEPARSLYRARALLLSGQSAAAAEEFRKILQADSEADAARVGLADAYRAAGELEEGLKTLAPLLAAQPQNPHALLAQGMLLVSQGRFVDAEEVLSSVQRPQAQLDAHQRLIHLAALTEAQLALGKLDEAQAGYDALVQVASNAPATVLLGARIAMARQDYATANAQLQRLVNALPDLTFARFLLGATLFAQGNLHQAEAQLTRVVQQAPENIQARKMLAQVLLRLKRPDEAMQSLAPMQVISETDADINALLGLAQLQLGDVAAGIERLEESARSRPENRRLKLELAGTHLQAGEPRRAIEVLRSLPHAPDDPAREVMLVHAVLTAHGIDAARAEVERLVAAHRESPSVLNTAALFHAQSRDFERARSLISAALSIAPDDDMTVLNGARIEFAAGNPEQAASRLEAALVAHPQRAALRFALAELAMRTGDLPQAARLLEELCKASPEAVEPRLALAHTLLLQRQREKADSILREVESLAPGRADIQYAIARLLLDSGRFDEAVSKFRIALDSDGRNAAYWFDLSRAQLALDRRALARESLERALSLQPNSLQIAGALVALDMREGKQEAADLRIAQLRKERPTDAAVHVLQGDVEMAKGRYAQAAESYDRALKNRATGAASVKAYQARRLAKIEDAARPLRDWVAAHPEDFAAQTILAEAYHQSGDLERAGELYERVVQNRPSNAAAHNNLAWIYYEREDPRAEAVALRAYELAPEHAAVADTYGWILVERGRLDEGLAIIERARVLAPHDPDIGYHYSAALARKGQLQAATRLLKELAARAEPFASQPQARRLLEQLDVE